MKLRASLILILIFLSFYIGYLKSGNIEENVKLSVSGKPIKVVQSDSKCIVLLGRFSATLEQSCYIIDSNNITIVGSVRRSLIDNLQGKIVLSEVTLDSFKKGELKGLGEEVKRISTDSILNYCIDIYRSFLPNNESELIAGIVLGRKDNIGRDFYQKMIKSGTIHVAVASGYNVMLVGSVVMSVLFWIVRRRWATAGAISVMIFYAVLAGSDPPVVRAVIMASLIYFSQVVGRKSQILWFLLLSIFLMLSWDLSLLQSASFQLSVMASLGMTWLSPWVIRSSEGWKISSYFETLEKVGVVTTLSTMVMTSPILWWHFGRLSLIGILSNILILPLIPIAMILGAGMLLLPSLLFVPTYAVLHLMVRIIYFFGT